MGAQRVKGGQPVPLRTFEQWTEISRLQEKAGAGGILSMVGLWLAACAVPLVGLAALLIALGVLSFDPSGAWRFTPEHFSWQKALPYLGYFLLGLILLGIGNWLGNFLRTRREQSGQAIPKPGHPVDQQATRVATVIMFLLAMGMVFLLMMFANYLRNVR
jgi:hypothetical protein